MWVQILFCVIHGKALHLSGLPAVRRKEEEDAGSMGAACPPWEHEQDQGSNHLRHKVRSKPDLD